MQRIVIDNFGPIGHFEANLDKNLNIFIGQQATGKSTIAKVVYFCENINNEFMQWYYMNEFVSGIEILSEEVFDSFLTTLKKQFTDTFAKVDEKQNYRILFETDGKTVDVGRDNSGYPDIKFNKAYFDFFLEIFNWIEARRQKSSVEIINLRTNQIILISRGYINDMLYIPSGRNLFSQFTSDIFLGKSNYLDDPTTKFAQHISLIRKKHSKAFGDIIKDKEHLTEDKINYTIVNKAIQLIHKILKGDYRYAPQDERIYYTEQDSVPLYASSSGQQEVLWILLILFDIILNNRKMILIIEEPEAHIFPETQKQVMELITLAINATESQVIITTHSPYILTSTNLLIHSANVENKITGEEVVVDEDIRLDRSKVGAYMLTKDSRFAYENIIDKDSGLIISEHIDGVSDEINMSTDKLIDLGVKHKI